MSNVLVVVGHPDLASFTAALASAYGERAREAGATVTHLALASLAFDPILHRAYESEQEVEPDLARAREAIIAADHIAWFFPMWWGGPPALVKGFVDRAFTPGFAFRYRGRNQLPQKLLAGRTARMVTSMDSPAIWYNLPLRRTLHASFCLATLSFVGIEPTRTSTFYELRFRSDDERGQLLRQVEREAVSDVRWSERNSRRRASPRLPAHSHALERPELLTQEVPDCRDARNAS